jgi:hypothetical protein
MMTESHFSEIYERYKATGLTVKSFCSNEGLLESRFYYWQRRLRRYLPESKGFVPIVIGQGNGSGIKATGHNFPAAASNLKALMWKYYPNGVKMKLQGEMDCEMLRNLLLLKP